MLCEDDIMASLKYYFRIVDSKLLIESVFCNDGNYPIENLPAGFVKWFEEGDLVVNVGGELSKACVGLGCQQITINLSERSLIYF